MAKKEMPVREKEGYSRNLILNEATKNKKMSMADKNELVSIGKALGTLTKEDIKFILLPETTEVQCQQRMIAARHRKE